MEDLLQLDCRRPQVAVLPVPLRRIVTPLEWQVWDHLLGAHPDSRFRHYIVKGIREGFRIGFNHGHPLRRAARNMQSVRARPEVINEYLAEECSQGRVLGPLPMESFRGVHVSRFGLVPKKTPGAWRLIVDLSSPEGFSVNDGIEDHLCTLRYMSVENALDIARQLGRGCLLAKMDVKKAYRMIPIHPDDRPLLGMQWQDQLYLDAALPFGLRSAPKIFTAVADAAEWIARSAGIQWVGHYLDDFLLAGRPNSAECQLALEQLSDLFQQLGVPVAQDKTEGPSPVLTFLGIEIDTVAMEVRLPREKLQSLQTLLGEWVEKRSCCRRELESLLGSLGHACCVVKEGKTFMRRLFELLAVARKPQHYVRLNAAARSDLCWWQSFLAPLNHRTFRQGIEKDKQRFTFATDASGSVGCGAIWQCNWIQLKWSEVQADLRKDLGKDSITFKELLPVVLAVGVWGPCWKGGAVLVLCDNQGAASAVNSGYSKVPRIMHLLRALFFIKARYGIQLSAAYLPGQLNVVADAISRDHLITLFLQVPAAKGRQATVSERLLRGLLDPSMDWTSPDWRASFRTCFPPA